MAFVDVNSRYLVRFLELGHSEISKQQTCKELSESVPTLNSAVSNNWELALYAIRTAYCITCCLGNKAVTVWTYNFIM